jgi:hypothetical protein
MGSANSPAIACCIGNSSLRLLRTTSPEFQGVPIENSWRCSLAGGIYHPRYGHGRVLLGADGEPVTLVWSHVDDYLVHGPNKAKTFRAFQDFLDMSVRLGFIYQQLKTKPPAQLKIFFLWFYL